MDRDRGGTPTAASVTWRHISKEEPRKITLKLDDQPLNVDRRHAAALPAQLDLAVPHVLSAEGQFPNGTARPEIVFGGTLPGSTGSQLTATLVHETGPRPASPDCCFAFKRQPI